MDQLQQVAGTRNFRYLGDQKLLGGAGDLGQLVV